MKPFLLFVPVVFALQVTPNSPCSALCIDNSSLDVSDPNSSNTNTSDIVCPDSDYDTTDAGRKFKSCLSCLQNSTFAQGPENDQAWFIYNLRFAFDQCVIYGKSSPCLTPESCGHLSNALTTDIHAASASFCTIDGGVFTQSYTSCLQCMQADGSHVYLANFFTALEAFCEQKPAPNLLLGVNETVFTHNAIEITQAEAPHGKTPKANPLSTVAIAGIAVGGIVVLALLAGCVYMQIRKRKNKAKRKTPSPVYVPDREFDDERFFAGEKNVHSAEIVTMSPVARSKPVAWKDALNIIEREEVSPASMASTRPFVKPKTSWTSSPVSPESSYASPALNQAGFERKAGSPSMMRIQTSFAPPPRR